jgi:hypothetical protein
MAHLDVAVAQELHLALHQRHGVAALVGMRKAGSSSSCSTKKSG